MRAEQIKYLLAVNKYHSISKAAEALFITQPALSRSLSSLEDELGAQLFVRNRHGAVLTPLGIQLLPQFESIVEATDSIHSTISEWAAFDARAELRIGAGGILCTNVLLDLTMSFRQLYPSVEIQMQEMYLNALIEACIHQTIDVGFLTLPKNDDNGQKLLTQSGLLYEKIMDCPLVAVFPTSSLLAQKEFLTEEDLKNETLVLSEKMRDNISTTNLISQVQYSPNSDSRNKMVIKCNGCAICSSVEMINDIYLQQGILTTRPFFSNESWNYLSIYLIYSRKLKHYEEDFVDMTRDFIRKEISYM